MLRRCLPLALVVLGVAAGPASAASVGNATSSEGAELTFTVTRDNPLQLASATTTGGTATANTDYTPVEDENVGFPLGATGTTFQVETAQDELAEGAETVGLQVEFTGGPTVTATGTILDDEPAIAVVDAKVAENAGAIDVTVGRTPVAKTTRVKFAVAGGTATPGGDYTPVSGEVTVPANADRATFRVPVAADDVDEDDETIGVTITAVDPALVVRGSGVLTIVNDDLRTLRIADATTVEGDGSETLVRIPVTLSGQTFRTVTAQFATVNYTARSPGDFSTRVGSVTIPPGQQQAFVDVPIAADDRVEQPEQFVVLVGKEAGAKVVDGDALVTITDDDAAAPDERPPAVRLSRPQRVGSMLRVRVSCPKSEQRCLGRVTFFSQPDRRAKARLLRTERRLARTAFSLRGGQAKAIRLRVPRRVAAAARRAGRLKVRAYVVVEDAAGNSATKSASGTLRY